MELSEEVHADLSRRLHRVAGQVAAIERMLNEGRECREVITQISACSKALDRVGLRLLLSGMAQCIENPDRATEAGFSRDEVENLLLKLG